jgi:hypothetical protein
MYSSAFSFKDQVSTAIPSFYLGAVLPIYASQSSSRLLILGEACCSRVNAP